MEDWVRFEVNPLQDNRSIAILCQAKLVDIRSVKSSQGISEERPVIRTSVKLGNTAYEIELTLANRDTMEYRMLLGREAISGRYLVDPSQSFVKGDLSEGEMAVKYRPHMSDRSGLTLGLLASNPELYSNKRIMEAGESRGHKVVFLNVENVYMKLDASSPEIRYRGGNILDKFDAVIPRIKPSVTFYGCALLRQFDTLGVYCLNTAEAISKSRDKLFASQLFSKNDLHIPITGF